METGSEYNEEALLSFLQPDESMKDFSLRTFVDPLRTSLEFVDEAGIQPGNIVEVCGASGSGKTEVLMQAIATCLLPEEADGVGYGGAGGAALCFDLDCRFDILRLVRILETRVNEAHVAQGGGDAEALNQVFTTSLQRFRLLQCHSTLHFLAALKMIQPDIRKILETYGQDSLRLICIDSIGAFHWLDKGLQGSGAGHRDPLTGVALSRAIIAELKNIMRRHRPLLMATKSAISAPYKWQPNGFGSAATAGRPIQEGSRSNQDEDDSQKPQNEVLYHKEYMPAPWQGFVTHRLVLQGPPATNPGLRLQDDLHPHSIFSAQWEKPPASAITRFIILDGCCKVVK